MSNFLIPLLIFVVAALVGMSGIMVKHRMFPPEPDNESEDGVGEYVAMMVGILYALVLGIALVAVWEARDNAESNVKTEASSLGQVYVLAQDIPAPAGPQIQQDVKDYESTVVDTEWPQMAAHKPLSQVGWTALSKITSDLEAYNPTNAVQQNVSSEALSQLSTVYDARRNRDDDSTAGLSPLMWTGLALGGVLTVAFVFCFGVQRRKTHLAMVMGLTGLTGFLMLLIFDLNHPFSGVTGIDAEMFTRYVSGG